MRKSKYVYKPTKKYIVFIIAFLCIGAAIIIGVSVHSGLKTAKINRYTVTTGTVVDYKVTVTHKGTLKEVYAYAEIAEFEVDGITYTVTNSVSSTDFVKNIGDTIEIAYNPENPLDCIFIAPNNIAFTVVLGIIGAIITGIGIMLLIYYCTQYYGWKKSK